MSFHYNGCHFPLVSGRSFNLVFYRNGSKWNTLDREKSPMAHVGLLIEGDLLEGGADERHPGRIDDGHRFDADLGRRQSELDRVRRHFEGVAGALLHARPHLVARAPQHLEPGNTGAERRGFNRTGGRQGRRPRPSYLCNDFTRSTGSGCFRLALSRPVICSGHRTAAKMKTAAAAATCTHNFSLKTGLNGLGG